MVTWYKRGQSILEYATLLSLIVSALLIMQFYVKRAYQGRLKEEADQVAQQYSPGHTTSLSWTFSATTSQTRTGGKITIRNPKTRRTSEQEIPAGMTVTISSTLTNTSRQEGVDSFATER